MKSRELAGWACNGSSRFLYLKRVENTRNNTPEFDRIIEMPGLSLREMQGMAGRPHALCRAESRAESTSALGPRRKSYMNTGASMREVWFYRDGKKWEIDLIVQERRTLHPVEVNKRGDDTLARHPVSRVGIIVEYPNEQVLMGTTDGLGSLQGVRDLSRRDVIRIARDSFATLPVIAAPFSVCSHARSRPPRAISTSSLRLKMARVSKTSSARVRC